MKRFEITEQHIADLRARMDAPDSGMFISVNFLVLRRLIETWEAVNGNGHMSAVVTVWDHNVKNVRITPTVDAEALRIAVIRDQLNYPTEDDQALIEYYEDKLWGDAHPTIIQAVPILPNRLYYYAAYGYTTDDDYETQDPAKMKPYVIAQFKVEPLNDDGSPTLCDTWPGSGPFDTREEAMRAANAYALSQKGK